MPGFVTGVEKWERSLALARPDKIADGAVEPCNNISPIRARVDPFAINCGADRRTGVESRVVDVLTIVGCVEQRLERRSFAGELSLSCARPATDG